MSSSKSTMDKDYSKSIDDKNCATITTRRDIGFTMGGRVHVIPCGFASDGFSCPRWAQKIVAPQTDSRTVDAAVKHDFLYASHLCNRFLADVIFLLELILGGFPLSKSILAFVGVRLWGWTHW